MIMDNTIVLDKTVDAAQTAVDDSVKFHVNNLELYYKDFHASKKRQHGYTAKEDHCIYRTVRMWKIYIFKDVESYE